jgi:hypothetical protein
MDFRRPLKSAGSGIRRYLSDESRIRGTMSQPNP